MKRIAIITPGVLPVPAIKGGAVESLIDQYIHFNREKKQYHLTVFSIFDPALSSRNDETTEYFYIRNNPILSFFDRCISLFQRVFLKKKNATTFKNLLYRYRYFLGVKKALEEQDFDLVILENHCSEFLCLKTKKLQQKYEGKVVFHSHNVPAHYRRVIRWMSCLKTIYSVSQALSSLWERALAESLPHVSFRVLRNGIDTSLFAPKTESDILAQAKSRFHLPKDKKIVLFAGRMTKMKGIFSVIEAMRYLPEDYFLLLAGDYFYGVKAKNAESIEIQKSLASIEGRFSFTGYVDHSEMPLVYSISDIVVLPSIEFDSAPLVLIEGISCCKPIITTNIGGIPEYSKGAGVLVLEIDGNLSKTIAEKVLTITNDLTLYQQMVQQSQDARPFLDDATYSKHYSEMISDNLEL